MTAFETVGVNRQFDARNIYEASKEFKKSCDYCCFSGQRIECDKCHISYTHQLMCKYFKNRKDKKKWTYQTAKHTYM